MDQETINILKQILNELRNINKTLKYISAKR